MKTLTAVLVSSVALISTGAHAFAEVDPSFASVTLSPDRTCPNGALSVLGDQGALKSYYSSTPGMDSGIARLRADGTLDASWGNAGRVEWPAPASPVSARQVFRLADGGFMVVGQRAVKIRADGFLDTTYGNGGVSDDLATSRIPNVISAAVLPDGRVVALLRENFGNPARFAVTRLDLNGRVDTAFGPLSIPIDPYAHHVYAWGIQGDGRVQVATYPFATQGRFQPEMHRFPDDFTPADGVVGQVVPRDVAALWMDPGAKVDPQGRLVLAGACYAGDCRSGALSVMRFEADGRVDASFGDNGRSLLFSPVANDFASQFFYTYALWLGRDGVLTVLAGHSSNSGFFLYDFSTRAYRLLGNGSLDPSFPNDLVVGDVNDQFAQLDDGRFLRSNGGSNAAGCQVQRRQGDLPKADALLVEYQYNGRYFFTAEGPESALLDRDPAAEKLRRTGRAFGGWLPQARPRRLASDVPLLRRPARRPARPFLLTAGRGVRARARGRRAPSTGTRTWRFEGLAFSEAPASSAGTCAPNLQPVYRIYNDQIRQGGDPNHRYTTDPAVIAEMQAQGWILEGVAFCAPPQGT